MNIRHKDRDWSDAQNNYDTGGVLRLLMDLRDELKEINLTLRCPLAQRIPRYLARIAGNTAKRKRK